MEKLRRAKTADYQELNLGADGRLLGNRYVAFFKRIEALWLMGKSTDGKQGAVPTEYDGENLIFEVRSQTAHRSVSISTAEMDAGAAVGHLDNFRRLWKKEAEDMASLHFEKAHEKAVSRLMEMDASLLDKTLERGTKISSYLDKAKEQARDMGIEL